MTRPGSHLAPCRRCVAPAFFCFAAVSSGLRLAPRAVHHESLLSSTGNATGNASRYTMEGAVLFLHGEEESAFDFRSKLSSFPNIDLPDFLIKHQIMPVFPDGEVMQNSTDGKFRNLWFNKDHTAGLQASESELAVRLAYANVIQPALKRMQDNYAVPMNKILVGGFSLGGDMALQMLRLQPDIGGIFCMSGYLPSSSGVYTHLDGAAGAKLPPVFMVHGDADMKVNIAWAEDTKANLEKRGVQVEFAPRKDIGHWLEEITVMKLTDWIVATYQKMYKAA